MKILSNNPLNGNGPVQLVTVGNSIQHKWVKCKFCMYNCQNIYFYIILNPLLPPHGGGIDIYQSPLILTELFQHNLINVSYLTAC